MLHSWCNDIVTVLRASVVTRNGRKVADWSDPTSHAIVGCSMQETTTETSFDGPQRDASASQARLFCPPDADIREGDRVVSDGRTWLVYGVPPKVKSPTGLLTHQPVQLREWRG